MTAQETGERLYALLDALRACLCEALGGEDTTLCTCVLTPATVNGGDCDCTASGKCGTAWVRVTRIFPTSSFPTPATSLGCNTPLAVGVELGVSRCRTVITDRGAPPQPVQLANQTLQQVGDALALWGAYSCCTEFTGRPYVLGTWQPVDGGNCGGGIWPATVHLVRLDAAA